MGRQRVLSFGMGNMYREKEEYLRTHYEMAGCIDNNAAGIKEKMGNIPGNFIGTPKEAVEAFGKDTKIILMSYQFVSMWQQLYDLGIDGDRVIFGVMFPPYNNDEEELFRTGWLMAEGKDVVYCHKTGKKYSVESYERLREIAKEVRRENSRKENPLIDMIAGMECRPVSRLFGMDRGTAIDRNYIEKFLGRNKNLICGNCLEIAEDTYTVRYGEERVEKANILHVEGKGKNAIKGDLATGEGIDDNVYDCAIITQTLMVIFDIQSVAQNIYRMLKKGGTALITVSGISQISRYDADRWGSYYNFHEDTLRKLFVPHFGEKNVEIHTYGNVKTAMALLYGLCCEDLKEEDFTQDDKDYPVIISAVLRKR